LLLRYLFALSACGALAGLTGCASATVQTDALLQQTASAPPPPVQISGVPFVEQSAGHCGPATLTMALRYAGKSLTVEEVSPLVYTPGVKGTFQADMISASRREGMVAIPIQGMTALLAEVRAGHPVIVFENLALSWLPQWHYAVVFGYDLAKPEVVMHSGPEESKHWDLRKFERSWMLGDYWGLVVLKPGELSASGDELAHVRATAALEALGKFDEAAKSYAAILKKWPESLGAAIGSANIAFAHGRSLEAAAYLERATQFHPQAAIAWHNLTIAYGTAMKTKQAHASAQRALATANESERQSFSESLKEWL
jgi:hypothetical protein